MLCRKVNNDTNLSLCSREGGGRNATNGALESGVFECTRSVKPGFGVLVHL